MNNQQPPEEIDILQFFNAVGKFFNSIFAGISRLFLSVFHFFLDLILYLKNKSLYLLGGILLGLVLAFFTSNGHKKLYSADALVRTNYQSQYLLQEQFEAFNYLIKKHRTDLLAEELGIAEETAKHFVKFQLEPVVSDVFLIDEYENYLRTKDTVVYKYIEFKDFKKDYVNNPEINTFWKLSVIADEPEIFAPLNKALESMVEKDEGIAKRQKNLTMALETTKEKTLKSLQEIDSMRALYNKIDWQLAQKDLASQAHIILNKNDRITSELKEGFYNLFDERMITLNNLEISALRLNKFASPLVYLSSFPQIGKKEGNMLNNPYVLYALLGFFLVLMGLMAFDFNRYLNRYQQKKRAKTMK